MNKNEWEMILTEDGDKEMCVALQEKSIEEIDMITTEVIACLDEIKRRFHLMKGAIFDLLTKPTDFEKTLENIRKEASLCSEFKCESFGCGNCGDEVEVVSSSKADAIQVFCDEAAKLREMLSSWRKYAEDVVSYCDIYLKAVFGKKIEAMYLPEPIIGKRLESGEWEEGSCRKRFSSVMLHLADHYDAKTMPFRVVVVPTFQENNEVRFQYFDIAVNRKALTDLLKEMYEIDEETVERLGEDYAYFVEVAHSFINVAARIMTPKGHAAFFARYGIEDGTSHSLAELAEKFGTTRERIRQLIDKESRKLKNPLHRDAILLQPDVED